MVKRLIELAKVGELKTRLQLSWKRVLFSMGRSVL